MRMLAQFGRDPFGFPFSLERDFFKSLGELTPFFEGASQQEAGPRLEGRERENEWVFALDVPGVKKESLGIEYEDNILTIRGERAALFDDDEKSQAWIKRVRVPEDVDADGIEAKLNDGVLRLRLPKAAKSAPKKIALEA